MNLILIKLSGSPEARPVSPGIDPPNYPPWPIQNIYAQFVVTRLPGNIMESIRVKAAKAFSKGQFAKNCLMLAEKIEIVPLTKDNETDVNIVGKKFEIK